MTLWQDSDQIFLWHLIAALDIMMKSSTAAITATMLLFICWVPLGQLVLFGMILCFMTPTSNFLPMAHIKSVQRRHPLGCFGYYPRIEISGLSRLYILFPALLGPKSQNLFALLWQANFLSNMCYKQMAHIMWQLFPGKLPLELQYKTARCGGRVRIKSLLPLTGESSVSIQTKLSPTWLR